jgi:hypothetical protein
MKYRIKTEREFLEEYGPNWKRCVGWGTLDDTMDYLLGKEVLTNYAHTVDDKWNIFPQMIKTVEEEIPSGYEIFYYTGAAKEGFYEGKRYLMFCPYQNSGPQINSFSCQSCCYNSGRRFAGSAVECRYKYIKALQTEKPMQDGSTFTMYSGSVLPSGLTPGHTFKLTFHDVVAKKRKTRERKYKTNY